MWAVPWAVIVTYIDERFVTEVRATGFSLSVLLGFLSQLAWLCRPASCRTRGAVLFIGGVIATIGAALGPETKNADF